MALYTLLDPHPHRQHILPLLHSRLSHHPPLPLYIPSRHPGPSSGLTGRSTRIPPPEKEETAPMACSLDPVGVVCDGLDCRSDIGDYCGVRAERCL